MEKRGVSVIIGYVLLIVFALVISGGVYAWLKTYVPSESLNCPDGLSTFVKDLTYDSAYNSTHSVLNITVRNNGRFDIAGYFIHASNSPARQLPALDISRYLVEGPEGIIFGSSVLDSTTGQNTFRPGDDMINTFYIPLTAGNITLIQITPTRFQEEDNRQRFVSCGNARVQQSTTSAVGGGTCTPNCIGRVCGSDGCGGSCGSCSSGFICDGTGQCVSGSCTPASNPCLGRQCGTVANGTCGSVSCGTCSSGFSCNATGQCIGGCGNGIIDTGEQCDDGNINSGDGCSSSCNVESGWTCIINPNPPPATSCTQNTPSCSSSCQAAGYLYGSCTNSAGNCQSGGGTYLPGGDQYCTGGSQADTCCCTSANIITLFAEGFETYGSSSGQTLYTAMNTNGWTINDTGGNAFDDVNLNSTYPSAGTYAVRIRNNAELIANVSTTGFNNINFSYARRVFSLESSEFLGAYWRIGNSGAWTQLETTTNTAYAVRVWQLSGAGNKSLIQLKFFLSGGDNDFGFIDRINVTAA